MMTREEAIATLEESKRQNKIMIDNPTTFWTSYQMADGVKSAKRRIEALDHALTALRPVSREQVEKVWRGDWKFEPDIYDCGTYVCSKCSEPWALIDGTPVENNMNFCPNCGAAMADEAVEMVMERMEALYGQEEEAD